ncbi:MAG: hypothetical protein RRY79_07535 [Clostridia bacterium]
MRCGCDCGGYMVQSERGVFSGCVCPDCGKQCTACMGNRDEPLPISTFLSLKHEDADDTDTD